MSKSVIRLKERRCKNIVNGMYILYNNRHMYAYCILLKNYLNTSTLDLFVAGDDTPVQRKSRVWKERLLIMKFYYILLKLRRLTSIKMDSGLLCSIVQHLLHLDRVLSLDRMWFLRLFIDYFFFHIFYITTLSTI